jgi:hypothetical protein
VRGLDDRTMRYFLRIMKSVDVFISFVEVEQAGTDSDDNECFCGRHDGVYY